MSQATTTPAFQLHTLTSKAQGDSLQVVIEFSLDPVTLEGEHPGEAEHVRHLLEHLTEELTPVIVITNQEAYAHYRQGLRTNLLGTPIPDRVLAEENLTREQVNHPSFNRVLFWAEEGYPRYEDVHHKAFQLNPSVQAEEVASRGTRTTFRWADSFQDNHATRGLLKQLETSLKNTANDAVYQFQEFTRLLQALSCFTS